MRNHAFRRNEPTHVQQTSLSGKIIKRWKFFLLLMRHFTKLRKLSSCYFFETVEVVVNGGEGTEIVGVVANDGKATEIVDVVPDDGEATEIICVRLSVLLLTTVKQQELFMLLHVVVDDGKATGIGYVVPDNVFFFLNICAKFWECLAACFKSFYP